MTKSTQRVLNLVVQRTTYCSSRENSSRTIGDLLPPLTHEDAIGKSISNVGTWNDPLSFHFVHRTFLTVSCVKVAYMCVSVCVGVYVTTHTTDPKSEATRRQKKERNQDSKGTTTTKSPPGIPGEKKFPLSPIVEPTVSLQPVFLSKPQGSAGPERESVCMCPPKMKRQCRAQLIVVAVAVAVDTNSTRSISFHSVPF